ncbi:MAG: DUF1028 domain-containing protein, partial [Candidatus Marinimicrobia bacterium]|nr:DUF1028 domain-containing protein [Candidatus Neomarinimicrobiota bacterium]
MIIDYYYSIYKKIYIKILVVTLFIGVFLTNETFLQGQSHSTFEGTPRFIATFSIVARDSITGELGIAVASRFFAVGTV